MNSIEKFKLAVTLEEQAWAKFIQECKNQSDYLFECACGLYSLSQNKNALTLEIMDMFEDYKKAIEKMYAEMN